MVYWFGLICRAQGSVCCLCPTSVLTRAMEECRASLLECTVSEKHVCSIVLCWMMSQHCDCS